MSDKVSLTRHNSRTNSKGNVMKPNHNDRDFESERELVGSDKNIYWTRYDKKGQPRITFEEAERKAYHEFFDGYIDKANEKALARRHKDEMKTVDDLLNSKRMAPEETLWYLGDLNNHAEEEKLIQFMNKFKTYMNKNYGKNFKIIDIALHVDEEGAPHIQERHTFIGHDEDGVAYPCQEKALEEMGVDLPDPNKKRSRKNCRKKAFDKEVREACKEIAKSLGLEILPEKPGSAHPDKNLGQYLYNKQKELEELEETVEELKAEKAELEAELESLQNATQQQRDFIYEQESAKRSFSGPSTGFTMPS